MAMKLATEIEKLLCRNGFGHFAQGFKSRLAHQRENRLEVNSNRFFIVFSEQHVVFLTFLRLYSRTSVHEQVRVNGIKNIKMAMKMATLFL